MAKKRFIFNKSSWHNSSYVKQRFGKNAVLVNPEIISDNRFKATVKMKSKKR